MHGAPRLIVAALAGALLGGCLGSVIGGVVVFGPALLDEVGRAEGGFALLTVNGWRIAGIAARLFGLPAALGGAAAALLAFREGRRTAWGGRPGPYGPALLGLAVAAAAAPAGLGLYVSSVLAGEPAAGRLPTQALVNAAMLCGAAGLLAGLVLGRVAARRARPRPLR